MYIDPSAAPQNVTALSANPSSVFVSWIPPPLIDHNGDLTSFTLLYSKIGSKNEHRVQLSANVTTYKIIQLIPSTKYRIKVACNNVNGSGPFSGPIKVFSGNNSKFICMKCFFSDVDVQNIMYNIIIV